MITSTILSKN